MPKMPNDAKLGLVVGMVAVLLIAVVFFRPAQAGPTGGPEATVSVQAAPGVRLASSQGPVAVAHEGEGAAKAQP